MIRFGTGPRHPWKLYYVPPDTLRWEPSADVVLIGDAAHATTPHAGEGANIASQDAFVPAKALKEHGVTREAIAAYEKEMFPRAIDVISRSLAIKDVFFRKDDPHAFKRMMSGSS